MDCSDTVFVGLRIRLGKTSISDCNLPELDDQHSQVTRLCWSFSSGKLQQGLFYQTNCGPWPPSLPHSPSS